MFHLSKKSIFRYIVCLCFFCIFHFMNNDFRLFATGSRKRANCSRDTNCISVLSYNIQGTKPADYNLKACDLANIISKYDPDIVFLVEDYDSVFVRINELLSRSYPYSNFALYYTPGGHYIYSKFPIGDTNNIKVESLDNSYVYQTMVYKEKDSLLVFGVHLASNNYDSNGIYFKPENIKSISGVKRYFSNFLRAQEIRKHQLESIIYIKGKYDIPCVMMGDFNDPPWSSNIRFLNRNGMLDSWWESGIGFGATIKAPIPMRIDYIMYNTRLKSDKSTIIKSNISDHFGLYASFSIKN